MTVDEIKTEIWYISKENLYCVIMCQVNINWRFDVAIPSMNDWCNLLTEVKRLKNAKK